MFSKYINQDYDAKRAVIRQEILFQPLLATDANTHLLRSALEKELLRPNDPVLTFTVGEKRLCLSLTAMIYHHVAQGIIEDTPWMVSFCVVCNAGMLFNPTVHGKVHHFADGGFYNAMTLLTDKETRSMWHHITGYCLDGIYKGQQLPYLAPPLQKTALQALLEYPQALLIMDTLTKEVSDMVEEENDKRLNPDLALPERWLNSLKVNDDRLSKFDMGLGVWAGTIKRFYPYAKIIQENALLDYFGGRNLLVYSSPEGVAPEAFYTDATHFEWLGDVLRLNNGQTLRNGILYDAYGVVMQVEYPQQLFQRWYSFTLLFNPNEIYRG